MKENENPQFNNNQKDFPQESFANRDFVIYNGGKPAFRNISFYNPTLIGTVRINKTPSSGTFTADKYIVINLNGVNYKIAVLAE